VTQFIEGATNVVSDAVLRFFERRTEEGRRTFYADDLRRFVAMRATVAQGTPDRILRSLRKAGKLNYSLINRAKSLYQIEGVVGW
jgi:hypothetical protein